MRKGQALEYLSGAPQHHLRLQSLPQPVERLAFKGQCWAQELCHETVVCVVGPYMAKRVQRLGKGTRLHLRSLYVKMLQLERDLDIWVLCGLHP